MTVETIRGSSELAQAQAALTMLEHKRQACKMERERLDSTIKRRLQAQEAARKQIITNLRKRSEGYLKTQSSSAERNRRLEADVEALFRIAEDTCLSSSQAANELRLEQRRYLHTAEEMRNREAREAKDKNRSRLSDLHERLQLVSGSRDQSLLREPASDHDQSSILSGPSATDMRSPNTSNILDSSLQASNMASSLARSLSRQPDPAVALAREKESARRQMMQEMAEAEEAAKQQLSAAAKKEPTKQASPVVETTKPQPAVLASQAQVSDKDIREQNARVLEERERQAREQQKPAISSGGTPSVHEGTLGETATSVASVSEEEQAEAQIAEQLTTPKMWYKTIRHLAKQLEDALKVGAGDGDEDMYAPSLNPCSAMDLALVISTVTSNANAVSAAGVSACASAFSELLRRYPGGIVPKTFVSGFLWDAAPAAYHEKELLSFLGEDAHEVWKAVRRHMSHVKAVVPAGHFSEALAQVLLGSTKPTAATRAKLKAFVETVSATPLPAAAAGTPSVSSAAGAGAVSSRVGRSKDDSDSDDDVGKAPAAAAASKAPVVRVGGGLMGSVKAKSSASSAGSGSNYKMSMSAMIKSTNLLRDLDDSEEESEAEAPAKAAGPAGSNIKSLIQSKQWATSTPVDDGDDEFDIL